MVAAAQRTRWTDAMMRKAINDFTKRRLWTVNRLAAELAYPQGPLELWLNGDPALPKLRTKLHRMIEHFRIEPVDADAEAPAEPEASDTPSEWSESDLIDPVDATLPVTASTALAIDEDTGTVQLGELTPNPDCPLPFGFALLMPLQSGYTGYPAAIVVREKSVAITGALRAELGDATHVVIGVESRTDRPDGEARIAIAPIGSDHPWFRHAHKLTKSGDWGEGFRKNLGLPGDVYLAERQGNAQLWICTRRQWATEKTAA